MPRILASTSESTWRDWLSAHPCPPDEPGAPTINDWLFKAAGYCAWSGLINSNDSEGFIRSALTRREKSPSEVSRAVAKQFAMPREHRNGNTRPPIPKLTFEPWKLERIAGRVSADVTDDWLAKRSAVPVESVAPSDFLSALYRPGETVAIVTGDTNGAPSGLSWLWRHGESLSDLTEGQPFGTWYQTNPVDGIAHECETESLTVARLRSPPGATAC
jgi:hypothetical protein